MDLILEGSELQAEGPATENALLAIYSFVLVLGWAKRPRRRWAQAVIATNVTQVW